MRLSTSNASTFRSMASKNFGDSGKIENKMALHKFTSDVHIKNKRHGFISNIKMLKLQSIGINRVARGDINTHTHDKAIVTNDTARAAVVVV